MRFTSIPPVDEGKMLSELFDLTRLMTCHCKDDGEEFTNSTKVNAIEWLLSYRKWCVLESGKLCRIVSHKSFDWAKPFMLLSSHIDECYSSTWVRYASTMHWIGTLDNSITNAIAMYCAIEDLLPVQTLIAFTGDEEQDDRGVADVLTTIRPDRLMNLKLVIAMDVTDMRYEREAFTFENISLQNKDAVLKSICANELVCKEQRVDEAVAYGKHSMQALSMCLPCAPYSEFEGIACERWMHWDCGFKVRPQDVIDYTRKLIDVCNRVMS